MGKLYHVSIAALVLAACGGSDEAPIPIEDGVDDAFLADGKADGGLTACQIENVLALVNALDLSVDGLKGSGIHTRAAKSIAAYRSGPDGTLGTADDQRLADLQTLDDLRYVGPVALRQIVAAAGDGCTGVEPEVEVIFSPQA